MLTYLGTRLRSHNFEDYSNKVIGKKGKYSLEIQIDDACELADPIDAKNDQKSHTVVFSGNAEVKGYSFNGDNPESLLDEEHLAFRVKAEFSVSFDVFLPSNSDIENVLNDEKFDQFVLALSKVGVVERLHHIFDSTSFRKIDIRRIPVECQLVPSICDKAK